MKENYPHLVVDARMINISGIGRYIQALIPALIPIYQVTVLGNPAEIEKFDWHTNVTVISVDAPIYSIKEQLALIRKTPSCDIFLSPHYNVPVFLPQAKKTVVIIPDTNHLVFSKDLSLPKRIYAKLFYKLAVQKDIIFTISHFSKSEIVKYTGCKPDKVIVATLAIDKEHFVTLDKQLNEGRVRAFDNAVADNYLLYIGNIKPHKNLKRALLAFDKIIADKPGLQFLIVGKKDNFLTGDSEVFDLVENNINLKNKVQFTGKVSDLQLAYLYKHASAFVFPSLYEGFGLPPLEAMIFGCPVVVSREGSLPEVCGDAAHYCNAYDVDNIAQAITEVLDNPTLRADLVARGHVRVNEFDWANFTGIVAHGLQNL
jgi:glycosyltransferase involved in cell wall biosynthesis